IDHTATDTRDEIRRVRSLRRDAAAVALLALRSPSDDPRERTRSLTSMARRTAIDAPPFSAVADRHRVSVRRTMEPIAPGSRTMRGAMAALFLTTLAPPAALAASCPVFPDSSVAVDVTSSSVTEASGLAISGSNPGIYWTHNDSGDSARFFAIDASTGAIAATYA